MLWKQLDPRYRRLLSSGEQGEAVVVDAKEDRAKGGGDMGDGGLAFTGGGSSLSIFGWKVTIRVKYADGSAKDFERYIEAGTAGVFTIRPGTLVPIRFDSKKRSRVEIDTNALRANRDARRARRAASVDAAVQHAEARLEPIDAPESES
jgi:hypothetical protein